MVVLFPVWLEFCFTKMYKLSLGLTQPPVQWLSRAFPPGVKRPRREAYHSISCV